MPLHFEAFNVPLVIGILGHVGSLAAQADVSGSGNSADATGKVLGKVLLFTDFHLDMYYGTEHAYSHCNSSKAAKYGEVGCDAPMALIESAVAAAQSVLPDPALVLVCGDSVRHDAARMPNGWQDISATLVAVTNITRSAFPSVGHVHSSVLDAHTTAVLTTAGNNVRPLSSACIYDALSSP
jgi:hypothetical protein